MPDNTVHSKDLLDRTVLQVFTIASDSIHEETVLTVAKHDVVRFTSAGTYKVNNTGPSVPFFPGLPLGIGEGVTSLGFYDQAGTLPTSTIVEVM